MKLIIFLVVVGVSHCAAVLLNPPKNANIVYKYDDFGRLEEIEIDHYDPKPVRAAWNRASKPVPMPTFRRTPSPTAAPKVNIQGPRVTYQQAPAKLSRTPTTYKVPAPKQAPLRTLYFVKDDDDFEQVFPMMFRLAAPAVPAPTPAPVTYRAPAPVAKRPAPIVYKAPAPVAYRSPAPVAYKAPSPIFYRAPASVAKRPASPYVRRFSVEDDSDEDDK